ncbi:SNF2-related protein [Desulfobacula toluolica]|uniref:RapA: RNA polymerase-associated protein A n=1 Tax=Desulfobacula toluolica (strain DSM 7467 / Tol2) TaxID=651182 RepID=K0NJV0_DESTT|nr:SNF2-related protein [Desulfobacula toluolica]CCK81120.1 RapA: RNA polymerase-associated protein A [Desulfobacula toluolica Tol2]
MHQFITGQRWISQAEPELGLGTLIKVNDRTISIRFDSSDCTRQYSLQSAPLKRVVFKPGDEIQLKDNKKLIVQTLSESEGLIYYSGKETIVCEKDLCDTISFSMPQDRLFAGITDSSKLFDLRYRLLKAKADYDASMVKGFLGGQVELIPHQFFIADKVTTRYIPRVLLSDETGLGKTIEACLILHKLLITHRAQRVLIVVPESLVHQWFIELYRKFNLSFMIFDADWCESLEQESSRTNPFLNRQMGIVSINFLKNKKRQTQIIKAGWDMVVIDEAHHITDDKKTYEFIQTLARTTFGLMLLTATPEQMGIKNHFLHLQLLDPERYFDFNTYLDETSQYKKTIHTVTQLIKKEKNTDHILDSYGPGRVIFRNKRDVIKDFPKRVAHLKPLAATISQIKAANREFFDTNETKAHVFSDDPRISCLVELIKQKKKLLVICSSKEKVNAIAKAVANHIFVDVAKFDETMSLLQRDRNAAWFSRKDGARILICSEIGSEGRNFQFVHHLFLFDLPHNPELLEQRIGRVDRIGQKSDIQIHVPYILGSVYEILARWYMDGLNLFAGNINGSHLIYEKFKPNLFDLFSRSAESAAVKAFVLEKLIEETKAYCIKVDKKLAHGKNILLEMNSFKPESAKKIIDHITRTEKNNAFDDLLTMVLDHYGIEIDFIDKTIFKLNSTTMTDEKFPALTSLSNAMTFNRKTAIARDDIDFFSWDHPFVQQTFEYFITNDTGSCATALLNRQQGPGILLETIFILECIAPGNLNMERYLMPHPIRIIVDHEGRDTSLDNKFTSLSSKLKKDQSTWFMDMEPVKQVLIPSMIEKSVSIAENHCEKMIKKGQNRIKDILGKEITRLMQLQKINPDIRTAEIKLARNRMESLLKYLDTSRLRMDAVRLIRVQ